MNINHFLTGFSRVLMSEEGDHLFSNLKLLTGGVTSHRTAKLLNFATSCLSEGECYLEVGVFTGYTIVSASYLNNRACVGIDSYRPEQIFSLDRDAVRERCKKNLSAFSIGIKILEADFKQITKEQVGKPVGVHFIDGDHNYEAVTKGFDWARPMLSRDAIVVFDDVCYPEICKAVMEIAQRPGCELVFMSKPLYTGDSVHPVGDRIFNTGLAIMRVTNGF